jgi:mycothiol synthase
MTSAKLLQLALAVPLGKMSDLPHIIRNFCPEDFASYVQLNVEAEELDPTGRCTPAQVLSEVLGRPNYVPGQDLFVAEAAGKVVGYIDVRSELGIGRAVLDCLVHPEHRRKGLATDLVHRASRRAREVGARVVHVSVLEENVAAKAFLSKLGFRFVRRFLHLTLELSEFHLPEEEQQLPLLVRHLQRGEEDKLTRIQNRSFAGTWGYNPNTLEEIVYRLNMIGWSPEDVILIFAADRPVGYCWTLVNPEASAVAGKNVGRIYMLGVDPDYQGSGIGERALLAGLAHLKGKGIEVAELTVDSQNPAACALYESGGFKISSTSGWYEKALD